MSEGKHTPGPWAAHLKDFGHINNDPYVPIDGNDKSIAYVMCRDRARGNDILEWKANARAIAALPDLIEALKYARNLIGPDEIIDAALAKAQGE